MGGDKVGCPVPCMCHGSREVSGQGPGGGDNVRQEELLGPTATLSQASAGSGPRQGAAGRATGPRVHRGRGDRVGPDTGTIPGATNKALF